MKQIELTELCSLNMGQSPESSTYNEAGNGLPFFQGNADFGDIHPVTRVWCSAPAKIANEGDILITVRAPIGAMNLAAEQCCIGRGLAALTPYEDRCNRQYLYYAIQSRVEKLIAKGTGSTFKAIGKKVLESTLIPAYSLDGQRKIAEALDKIDSLTAKRRCQIEKLDELVKSRFVEIFFGEKYPDERIEELCASIVDCPHTTPKYKGELKHPSIRTSEIKKGYITWDTMRYVSDVEYKERVIRLRPEAGDIVYGREGIFGNAAILPNGYKFCLGQRVMLLRPDYSKCTSEYLLYALISDDVYRQAKGKNNASTVAHVNVKDVKQFIVPLPPLKLQQQFAAFVEQTDKLKSAVRDGLNEIETLKKSLMQKYFG